MLIYAAIIFVLVTVCSITLLNWMVPTQSKRRLQELANGGEKSNWVQTVVQIAQPLAKLSIPEGKWEESPLRLRFMNAGIRSQSAPVIFYAAKTVLPLVFALGAYAGMQVSGHSLQGNMLLLALLLSAT